MVLLDDRTDPARLPRDPAGVHALLDRRVDLRDVLTVGVVLDALVRG